MKNESAASVPSAGLRIFRHPVLHGLVIVLLALLPYLATIHYPFYLDDGNNIVENPMVKDLDRFLDGAGFRYNPWRFIGFLTLTLNYHYGGLNVVGYHIVNILIHILVALAVWTLVRVTFRTPQMQASPLAPLGPMVALVAALLFAVHPVQTQAVTYIVQRFAAMATLFYLLALVLYGKARIRMLDPAAASPVPAVLLFAGSAVAAILAMASKEIAFTLPFAVLLYEFSFFRPGPRRRLLLLLPFAGVAAALPLIFMGSEGPLKWVPAIARHLQESTHIARPDYFFTQFRVIVTYLRLLVLPVEQNLDYQYPIYSTFFTAPVFFSAILLTAILVLALWLYRRSSLASSITGPAFESTEDATEEKDLGSRITDHVSPELRLAGFGILFFFLTLSVESSIIPIGDVIFEHRLYLPSVGLFMALAVAAIRLASRFAPRAGGLVLAVVILALGTAAYNRNLVWRDPVVMWTDVVKKSPVKERGYVNLAYVLLEKGELDKAIENLNKAYMLNPGYAKTSLNLGIALGKKGRLQEAASFLEKAVELDPKMWIGYLNLGIIESMLGLPDKAIGHLETAARLNPYDPQIRLELFRLYLRQGESEKARAQQQTYNDLLNRH